MLLSIQQKYIQETLRKLGCVRADQLHALVRSKFQHQNFEISETRMVGATIDFIIKVDRENSIAVASRRMAARFQRYFFAHQPALNSATRLAAAGVPPSPASTAVVCSATCPTALSAGATTPTSTRTSTLWWATQ